jgi:DNA-binding CsgD family transcriptional regulator
MISRPTAERVSVAGTNRKRTAETASDLERGRASFRDRAWGDAFRALRQADQTHALDAGDLECLAMSAALTGQDNEFLNALERAHHARLDAGERPEAAKAAFWLGLRLLSLGETGRATGWFTKAERLIEDEKDGCVERGYLLLPRAYRHLMSGKFDLAEAASSEAASVGEDFADPDLIAFARSLQGRSRIRQGQVEQGLALLDDVMVTAMAGSLSPVITGLIYCSVIECCHQVFAFDRAREWTAALAAWCKAQPQLVTFTGTCLVHRAEILRMNGAWRDAMEEARRACERCAASADPSAAGAALYEAAEVYRLRGDYAAAEAAYRDASQAGRDPLPGLALLRSAQGKTTDAIAAIRRSVSEATDSLRKLRLLPAFIEIAIAAGAMDEAREACKELEQIALRFDTDVLAATAAHARGAIALANGDAAGALGELRSAFGVWQRVGAPYIGARIRVLVGRACQALGDREGARLEFAAAKTVFEELGAVPDLMQLSRITDRDSALGPHPLSQRELQILQMVAAGRTNKSIADELSLSEKTIDRHLSNIFVKLDVTSRTAAAAYAYRNKLV